MVTKYGKATDMAKAEGMDKMVEFVKGDFMVSSMHLNITGPLHATNTLRSRTFLSRMLNLMQPSHWKRPFMHSLCKTYTHKSIECYGRAPCLASLNGSSPTVSSLVTLHMKQPDPGLSVATEFLPSRQKQ